MQAVTPALEPRSSHSHRAVSVSLRIFQSSLTPFRPSPPTTEDHAYLLWLLTATRSKCQFLCHPQAWEQLHRPCHHLFSTCVLHSAQPDASLLPLSQCPRCSSVWASRSRTVPEPTLLILQSASHMLTLAKPWLIPPHQMAGLLPPAGPSRRTGCFTRSVCLCFACESCVLSSFLPSLTQQRAPRSGNASICWLQKRQECPCSGTIVT